MKFAATFTLAWGLNILLFLAMMQMISVDHEKEWIRTTSGDFFNFIRQPPKTETIPRRPANTPPKPDPEPAPATFSKSIQSQTATPSVELRALPLPVSALKVDIPLNGGINIGSGPTLPRIITGGQSRSAVLGSAPSVGSGKSGGQIGYNQPSFIMADELTAIMKVEPVYPQELRFRRIQGEVLIEFTVTSTGSVTAPKVIKSSPAGSFDRAALRAIGRWRFQPRRNDKGQPMAVRVRQHFVFKLH